MNEKIYNLIENKDGTLTAVINEGVIRLEEYPFMPKPLPTTLCCDV